MLVRDVATTTIKTVTPEFSVRNAMDLLRNNAFRHLPVVDQNRNVEGILSQSDLGSSASMARMFGSNREEYESFLDIPVRELLKTRYSREGDLVVVGPDDPIESAVQAMLDHKLTALPVVEENGELFGIVSYIDVLNALLDSAFEFDE